MIVHDFTKKDVVEWVLIQRPEFGVEAQWQARAFGRSVAVLAAKTCEAPHCDCVQHYRDGRVFAVDCDAERGWRGILVGPDSTIVDLELTRRSGGITLAEAQAETERGLRDMGWRV